MTPLTGALPLRTTAVWDAYREAQPIPHRYGETAGALLQYSSDRRIFVWADHAVAGIDTVLVSGQQVSNWQHRNGTDSTGHAVALVEFDGPVDEGAELIARGRGKTANGRLMTNPADVVLDILNTLAERGVPAARLDDFRAACQLSGLELGGSIEAADTVRAVITGLCNSIGAVWADDARGLCHLWPVAELTATTGTLPGQIDCDASADAADLVNDITLRYQFEGGSPRAAVQLDAPDWVLRHGRRTRIIDAPWIASSRVATDVATRLLQQHARPQWSVTLSGIEQIVRVGEVVPIDHAVLSSAATGMVLGREYDLRTQQTQLRTRIALGNTPAVRLVRQSSALEATQYEGLTLQVVDNGYQITLTETDGRPIVGASATLDEQTTRISDGAGRVIFPASAMTPGVHVVVILTADKRTLATQVTI